MTTEETKCKVCGGDKMVVVGEDNLVPCLFCRGTGEEDWEEENEQE